MKTLFKSILVLAVLLGTGTSYANEVIKVKTTFSHTKVKEGNQISVTDALGQVVYNGRINFNGDIKNLFDFSQLNDGTYTVEVNKDFEIEINSLEVKNNVVTYSEGSSKVIFKPVFRTEDSIIIISKLAIDTKEMSVELYFENNLIHSETVKGSEILNRVYKLDTTFKGDYTAIIKANDRVYVENFRI